MPITAEYANELMQLSVTTFYDAFAPHNTKADMDLYIAQEMNLAKFTEELNDTNNLFFGVAEEGKFIAYLKMRIGVIPIELQHEKPIEIERLYVLKEHQNKKIGALLIQFCKDYAIKNLYSVVWLGVWEHNYRAIKFYEQLGFEKFGAHDFLLGSDMQTDELMILYLS